MDQATGISAVGVTIALTLNRPRLELGLIRMGDVSTAAELVEDDRRHMPKNATPNP